MGRFSTVLCLLLLLVTVPLASGAEVLFPVKDSVDAAVDRGINFLVTQQREDGSFKDKRGRDQHHSVMTALALMSMAAIGHLPSDETVEGSVMRKAIHFLTREDRQTPKGYFGDIDGSRMYGHGIITLALSEMLGMGIDPQQDAVLRTRVTRAIELILRSQRVNKHSVQYEGGWRYTPTANDSDLSISVWQLMALRSAKNSDIAVPKASIDIAVEYLRRSYKSQRDKRGKATNTKSGFGYQPGRNPEFATTSAGLLALQVCGEYETPEIIGATNYLLDLTHRSDGKGGKKSNIHYKSKWFFYGTYYYAQAMMKRGQPYAAQARNFTEKILLDNQRPDGCWEGGDSQERTAGRIYSTSMAILCLSVKYHYLPIFQY
ncbi:terpene cyclase/mutase family protein [Verrucomicrobia bacterium]|nr:terpene cyclase/mutase family protein [Verrucomicrobiota bacterium]